MKLCLNPDSALYSPTYFIADIAANHDGSLERALELIRLAAESGADAAKFQNFKAETIVSRKGFQELGGKLTHQAKWKKDVYEVYQDAALPMEWTEDLRAECLSAGIDYFTAPYDLGYIDYFSDLMPHFKIGSGDITWKKAIVQIAKYGKPVLIATGASTMSEVEEAVSLLESYNVPIILMQCNTNYTGAEENFDFLNLQVLDEFRMRFPNVVLGFSDHSQGHVAVLGAVALGARAVEKHFTDDVKREGPDHQFSLDPGMWKKMVEDTRVLERCLGDGLKTVEVNEKDARIVQRRALRFTKALPEGHTLKEEDLIALRPCPTDGVSPFDIDLLLGKRLIYPVNEDDLVRRNNIAD
jgi:N-acetylneuraminate synthase